MSDQPAVVGPSQVPMTVLVNSGDLDQVDGTRKRVVQVQIASPTGVLICFWDPDAAEGIAGLIHKEAQKAKAGGLVVASAEDVMQAEAHLRAMPDLVDPKQGGNRRQRRGQR